MKNSNLINSIFISGILIICLISSYLFKAPSPLSAGSSDNQFSAIRAFEHVKQIAQKPHSIGTQEHERVKNYIVAELKKIGLETKVQTATSIDYDGDLNVGYVKNVIGIIKGIRSHRSVLIVGHYDSQPNTLGAADDGSAVASMLESARTLKQLGGFQNDIVFLFTDGEESGLFGAKAFIDENPLKDSIGIVLNIEARGSSGPSITYEVSPQNGWIMREYAKAIPYPFAQSIAYEIYKLLPNDSDFTPFRKAGLSGFNIAFIDDFVNYHSMTDNPENLSLQSLQHHGSYILGIAKHFGALDLSNTKSEDVVYFNFIGHYLVICPVGLNVFFVLLITLLMVCVICAGLRKNRLSIVKVLIGSAIFVGTLVVILTLSWLLLIGIKLMYPYYSNFYSSNFYNVKDYFIVFSCLVISVFSTIYNLFYKRMYVENLLMGVLLVNYIMLFFILHFIPTGAYLAIIPLIFLLTAILLSYIFNLSDDGKRWIFLLIHFILLAPVISLFVPFIEMLYVTFGLSTIYGGVAVLTIFLGYLILPIRLFSDRLRWLLPMTALVILVVKLVVGQAESKYTKLQPLQSNVSYLLNADLNKACWFSSKQYLDEWKSQFFKNSEYKQLDELSNFSSSRYLQNSAIVYRQSLPELHVVSDSIRVNTRNIQLNICTTREAQNCLIQINRSAQLYRMTVNGRLIANKGYYSVASSEYYTLVYFGLSQKELELNLDCNSTDKIELSIIESKIGLPEFDGFMPMPENINPDKGFYSNVTLVKRTWNL